MGVLEFFLNNTNLTFLAFLYKIDILGFQNQQKKSCLHWELNSATQPPRHLLNRRSLNWTWIISGSIVHDFIRVWKYETGMNWQIGWVVKAVRLLIHRWLVLWLQFPVEATLFLLILKAFDVNFVQKCKKCQICVIWEKLDWIVLFVVLLCISVEPSKEVIRRSIIYFEPMSKRSTSKFLMNPVWNQ